MKTAVVSGANGFVGAALVKELADNGVFVYALTSPGRFGNVPKSGPVEVIETDLCKCDGIGAVSADVFYHLAWSGVAGTDRADAGAQTDSMKMTCSCVGLAKKCGCRRFVCAGSIIGDEAVNACAAADGKPGPGYIYGIAKYAAGAFAKIKCAEMGIDYVSAKISNIIGVGEISERLISVTLQRIFNKEPLKFTEGRQNYDFIFISDAVCALRLIGEKGNGSAEYFIGSGNPKPLREYLLELRDIAAPGYEFRFGDVPFHGVSFPAEYFDITPLKELGFEPKVPFGEAIRRNAEYFADAPPAAGGGGDGARTSGSGKAVTDFAFKKMETFRGLDVPYVIQSFHAEDLRGGFTKDYSGKAFENAGIRHALKEVFYTTSKAGVLRGMHFQSGKPQQKLVRCISGHIYDVIADLDRRSPTYGKWAGFHLTGNDAVSLFIPGCFGHGFLAVGDSVVCYKCSEDFCPEGDFGIRYDDPDLDIRWPFELVGGEANLIISDRDLSLMNFREYSDKCAAGDRKLSYAGSVKV